MRLHADRNTPSRRSAAALVLITTAVLAAGCGTLGNPSAAPHQAVRPDPWPSAADYGTIKTAVAVRDQALFHEQDWQHKAFAAMLAARTLLTVRIAAGRCATYVTQLYGNLRDLMDAYAGENWHPLIRLVRRQPPLADACDTPYAQQAHIGASA
jgi:hypothetical protein